MQPLGGFDFPLGYPWLVHRKQYIMQYIDIREENSAGRQPKRCSFPLKCGQITKTAAGHLMAMGAPEPSSNITEQANRWQWSLSIMIHDTAYVVHTCASTICTMRYALMDHCVRGVALCRPMACSSYAHSIHLRAREL